MQLLQETGHHLQKALHQRKGPHLRTVLHLRRVLHLRTVLHLRKEPHQPREPHHRQQPLQPKELRLKHHLLKALQHQHPLQHLRKVRLMLNIFYLQKTETSDRKEMIDDVTAILPSKMFHDFETYHQHPTPSFLLINQDITS